MRARINDATKAAMRAKSTVELSTLRLMAAAIKDKDIEARAKNHEDEGISDDEILAVLATMIKQRRESVKSYEEGGRIDLAEREQAEIEIINTFMPKQLNAGEVEAAITDAIAEAKATSIKDMGKIMTILKDKHLGKMDFVAASGEVKKRLIAQ